jgi:putative YhbY family RNA-binding protein
MPAILLTPAERRRLRADAHHLHPVVLIGAEGLTDAVRKEADAALKAHGLIKLRVFSDERETREQMLASLTDELGAAAVQHIGKLLVLWRPVLEKPKEVREERQPGPRVVKLVSFSKSGNHRATVKKVKVLGNERVTPGGTIKRKEVRQVSPKKRAAD